MPQTRRFPCTQIPSPARLHRTMGKDATASPRAQTQDAPEADSSIGCKTSLICMVWVGGENKVPKALAIDVSQALSLDPKGNGCTPAQTSMDHAMWGGHWAPSSQTTCEVGICA